MVQDKDAAVYAFEVEQKRADRAAAVGKLLSSELALMNTDWARLFKHRLVEASSAEVASSTQFSPNTTTTSYYMCMYANILPAVMTDLALEY